MVKISIVVAVAKNGVIGADGGMPWHLSTDLQRFKRLTMGNVMIMGRKTFDSIGKALPGRTSIVVTRSKEWQAEGVVPVTSLEAAFDLGKEIIQSTGNGEICVVGGGEIYRQSMEFADTLHLTRVMSAPDGDTVFPEIDKDKFALESEEKVPSSEKDSVETVYCVYRRRDNVPSKAI